MNAGRWTFKVSGILIVLVVAFLAANPVAAEPNNGHPTYRERIDAARKGCKDSGGTFSMTIETSQGRSHTKCAEKDGTTTNCTITMSSSECENTPPAENSMGSGHGRVVDEILIVDAEITQADRPLAAPGDALPAIEQNLTVEESVDSGTTLPVAVAAEAAPIQPIEAAPIEVLETEDEVA